MKVVSTKIEGLLLIEELSLDDLESFPLRGGELSQGRYAGDGGTVLFSRTRFEYENIRELRFQRGQYAQTRFVRVSFGKICGVVLDMRKDSMTFGQYVKVELREGDGRGVLIPAGCAHGFSSTSGEAEMGIWCDRKFCSQVCGGVHFRDRYSNMDWGIPSGKQIFSLSDARNPLFRSLFSFRRSKAKNKLNFK